MPSQTIPCPRCGKPRRVRHNRTDAQCRDCIRATFTPGIEDALEGGYWERRGLIQVFVAAPVQPVKPKRSYLRHEEHDSVAGYRRHLKHDETPCESCRDAMRRHWRAYKSRERRGPRLPLSPCGTYNAYVRHRRHDEQPCEACCAAHLDYIREYRRKARAKARATQSEQREAA